MTTAELLQLAAADLIGLLDEAERARFDEAFVAADPAVQSTIRREQARTAESILATLPTAEPPAYLRALVLERVLGSADGSVDGDDHPDAAPGQDRSDAMRDVIPFTGSPGAAEDHWKDIPTRGVSRYWRAASFILLGLSLALGALYHDSRRNLSHVVNIYEQVSVTTFFQDLPLSYRKVHGAYETLTVHFVNDNGIGVDGVVLESNERLRKAYLAVDNVLIEDAAYELYYVHGDAEESVLVHSFTHHPRMAEPIDLAVALPAGGRWEIREADSGEAVLIGTLA